MRSHSSNEIVLLEVVVDVNIVIVVLIFVAVIRFSCGQ